MRGFTGRKTVKTLGPQSATIILSDPQHQCVCVSVCVCGRQSEYRLKQTRDGERLCRDAAPGINDKLFDRCLYVCTKGDPIGADKVHRGEFNKCV